MKHKIIPGILVILLSIGFANAATLNVGQGQTYTAIQSAVNVAKTGDVISVSEGTYSENIIINTNVISIIGQNKDNTIIDGKKTSSVIRIEANNVNVSGFTIQNSGGSGQYDAGITIYHSNNNEIANMIVVNNIVGIAIYQGSNSNVVSGNDIRQNSKYGIYVFASNDNKIYNNNIQGNAFGFYGDTARTNQIYSNNFIDNTNQAYDNSGLNTWDGNYWSPNKAIMGGTKAKDNNPLSSPVTIKEEEIATPAVQNTAAAPAGTGKSAPGFAGIVVMVSVIAIWVLKKK